MAWPKTVPILTENDIHKGGLDGPNNTHCLIGWCDKIFPDSCQDKVFVALRNEIGEFFISSYNDRVPRINSADTWNRVMAKLGYVVGNPETTKIRKK